MNRWLYWGSQLTIIAVIVIASSYATVTTASSGSLHVFPRANDDKVLNVDLNYMANARFSGSFEVTNGSTKDIEMRILDEYNFINWRNGYNFTSITTSGRVSAERFNVLITESGLYHVIFDNSFSESPKDIEFELRHSFTPVFLGLPVSMWILVGGVIISALLSYFQYTREQKRRTSAETNLMAISLAFVVLIGLSWFLSPGIASMISTLLTVVNVFLIIWNLRLAQRNMKIQLLHADRKKSFEKLYSILEKSENYAELIANAKEFMESLDFELLPEKVKREVRDQISRLEAHESEAPWHPQYTPEEMEQMIREYDEGQAEELEEMDEGKRFERDLDSQADSIKWDIRKVIKDYFQEPSEE